MAWPVGFVARAPTRSTGRRLRSSQEPGTHTMAMLTQTPKLK
jgi:hypothetical protein